MRKHVNARDIRLQMKRMAQYAAVIASCRREFFLSRCPYGVITSVLPSDRIAITWYRE
jgi:hypothetical protein